jgi:hypothetical protein
MRRRFLFTSVVVALALSGQAAAQPVESEGETSFVQMCFYTCKPGPEVLGKSTWQETIALMVAARIRSPRRASGSVPAACHPV